MLASGVAELISLGSVLPFLAVLSDPGRLWQITLVRNLAEHFALSNANELLLPATIGFAGAAVLAALIRMANLWLNGKIAASIGSDLSCEAYRRTLYQPYIVHVRRNSSSVITAITTQIAFTTGALKALLQLITAVVVALGLLIGLFLIDAPVALAAVILFGCSYGILAVTARRELRRNSNKIAEASNQQIKALQEGLGAIRDLLLDGTQSSYLDIYRQADHPQRQLQAKNTFLAAFPRFALEALGIALISLLGGLLVLQRDNQVDVIPVLGALALGAQRLLPALQQFYSSWAILKGCNAAIEAVLGMLNQPLPLQIESVRSLPLRHSIRFESVCFRYEPDHPDVLQGLNLEIRQGERIGIIGSTGCGKSTMVDILMGLLEPTGGRVLVDNIDLHNRNHPDRLSAWRSAIAHVPQTIYLSDGSIAENIAFGIPTKDIDMARVKQAAENAQISEFIESSSYGYKSFVGERGIRLSGGQRQRLGIARALYKKAKVLVFDEATSALDVGTEEAVMQSIERLSKELTIIMIAHRLSTISSCDRVIELKNGIVQKIAFPSDFNSFSPS